MIKGRDIQGAIVSALRENLGEWVDTDLLIRRVYDAHGYSRPIDPKNCIKVMAYTLRPRLLRDGLILEGHREWLGRGKGTRGFYRLRPVAAA